MHLVRQCFTNKLWDDSFLVCLACLPLEDPVRVVFEMEPTHLVYLPKYICTHVNLCCLLKCRLKHFHWLQKRSWWISFIKTSPFTKSRRFQTLEHLIINTKAGMYAFPWQRCASDAGSPPGQDGSRTLKRGSWSDRSSNQASNHDIF